MTKEIIKASAIARGRTLDPFAVDKARQYRTKRIADLNQKVKAGTATFAERKELKYKWGLPLKPILI